MSGQGMSSLDMTQGVLRAWGRMALLGGALAAMLCLSSPATANDEAMCRDESLRTSRVEACSRLLSAAFKADSETLAKLHEARGQAYADQGLYQEAAKDQSEVVGRRPNSHEARLNRGISYFQLRQFDLALADFSNALTLKPDFQDAYFWRGRTYRFLGRHDAALSDLNKALELNGKDGDALFVRGRTHSDMGNAVGALADYAAAIAINPKNRGALYNRAGIYRSQRNFEAALRDLDSCFKAAPDDPACYTLKGQVLSDMQDQQGAIYAFGQAIARDPQAPEPYRYRAAVFRAAKDFPRAIADLTSVLALTGQDAQISLDRGWLFAATLRPTEAVADYGQVIALDRGPLAANAHFERALTYLIAGNTALAAEDLKAARKAFPKNAWIALWLYVTETRAQPATALNLVFEHPAVTRLRMSLREITILPEHRPLIDMALGQASMAQAYPAVEAAIAKRGAGRTENLCALYAIIGSYYLGQGDEAAARLLFARAAALDAPFTLACYTARAELSRLQAQRVAGSIQK